METKMETKRKQKQYPTLKKNYIEKNKDKKKLFSISGVSIKSIEIFISQAKLEGMSNREYFEKIFK
jgi:hypothetical protein